MTDLIARLEELRANVRGVYDGGALMHDMGDETCEEDCHACAFDLAVEENFPAILHALKVQKAAEAYADAAEHEDIFALINTRARLVRAVKGEQP